jgi:hypothetical protein
VSRGPTRPVRKLIDAGVVPPEWLVAASHEADALAHPYIGVEHLELARLTLEGRHDERDAYRRSLGVGVRRRWWRPRGPRSALRRRGLRETAEQRLAALQAERLADEGS